MGACARQKEDGGTRWKLAYHFEMIDVDVAAALVIKFAPRRHGTHPIGVVQHVEVFLGDNVGAQVERGRGENRIGEQLNELGLVLDDALHYHLVVLIQLGEISGQTTWIPSAQCM
jgi:hypothetical protein